MEKEKHVCALKYAKELKKLGYPQDDSLWYWIRFSDNPFEIFSQEFLDSFQEKDWMCVKEKYAAPTVAELGEVLPNDFMSYKKDDDMWLCCKHHPEIGKDNEMIMEFADIEADARAKMVNYLLRNKRIKVEDL